MEYFVIGLETGDCLVYEVMKSKNNQIKKLKQITTLQDAADYISDMTETETGDLLVTSGDGTMYMYDPEREFVKVDNNATEEYDFTAVQSFGNRAVVGTNSNSLLIYNLRNLGIPTNTIKMESEVEGMWKFGFNVILLGLSNGELHAVCTQPLKDLGIMYAP